MEYLSMVVRLEPTLTEAFTIGTAVILCTLYYIHGAS